MRCIIGIYSSRDIMLATFTTGETDTVHNIRVASLGNNETGCVRIALVDIDRYM